MKIEELIMLTDELREPPYCVDNEDYLDAVKAVLEKQIPHQLSLDELRQMDGSPVWVEIPLDDFPGEWALASEFCQGATTGTSVFLYSNYGEVWTAYDRPPGGEGQ